tara:strand:+ start:408 stop:1520 length:1113 start_codon:yes stop_codon:yes gene_type:complete
MRRFKFKVNGESPRSLLLSYLLAKLNCDVYIYDFFINTNFNNDHQIFLFSNFTKNLLIKDGIWREIEDISYGFTSFCIKDNLISEQFLLRTEKFSKNYFSTFGWTVNYSDMKNLFIDKLNKFDNVHFISKDQLIDEPLVFDYEFNFNSYNKFLKLPKFPISLFKGINQHTLTFIVYLRGNIEKRLYEINTTEGLLVLTPIDKNLYQIVWNNPSSQIKRSLNSKSLFLDNLTALLSELNIDQIIGDIDSQQFTNYLPSYLIKNKSIYFNENKLKSNTLYDFNFNILIRNIIQIYNSFENNNSRNNNIANKIRFQYLLKKYIKFNTNIYYSNLFIILISLNNIFMLFLRKIIFILLHRINILRILLIKNLIN